MMFHAQLEYKIDIFQSRRDRRTDDMCDNRRDMLNNV